MRPFYLKHDRSIKTCSFTGTTSLPGILSWPSLEGSLFPMPNKTIFPSGENTVFQRGAAVRSMNMFATPNPHSTQRFSKDNNRPYTIRQTKDPPLKPLQP